MQSAIDAALASALGAITAIGELVTRYRDSPTTALIRSPAIFYIFVNAIASGGAFALILAFDWKFGAKTAPGLDAIRILVAGFGAMAFFRSSLFRLRLGDHDVEIGPSAALEAILQAADRGVDRQQALDRSTAIKSLDGLDFEKSLAALPTYCFQLLQNVPDAEIKAVANLGLSLKELSVDPTIKLKAYGLGLMSVVGPAVLKRAAEDLSSQLQPSGATG